MRQAMKRKSVDVRLALAAACALGGLGVSRALALTPPPGANQMVTLTFSGSTASRAALTDARSGYLESGASITFSNGTYVNGGAASIDLCPDPWTGAVIGGLGAAAGSGLQIEWHEQGSVEGILELVDSQLMLTAGVSLPAASYQTNNLYYQMPKGLNGGVGGAWTPAVAPAKAYGGINYVAVTGAASPGRFVTVGGNQTMSAVQMAISDVHAQQGFTPSGSTLSLSAWNRRPFGGPGGSAELGYGMGNPALPAASTDPIPALPSGATVAPAGARYNLVNDNTVTGGVPALSNTTWSHTAMTMAANPGTGLTKLTKQDVQWLNMTGRLANGADFMMSTRDVNSGTRNAIAANSGYDPSWGVGENDNGNGNRTDNSAVVAGKPVATNDLINIGSGLRFSNKTAGGGQLRPTIQNARMGIGTLSLPDVKGVSGDYNTYLPAIAGGAGNGSSYFQDVTLAAGGVVAKLVKSSNVDNNPLRALPLDYGSGAVKVGARSIIDSTYPVWTNQVWVTAPTSGPDVAAYQKMVLNSSANFGLASQGPADAIVGNGYILNSLMDKTKAFDGMTPVVNGTEDLNLLYKGILAPATSGTRTQPSEKSFLGAYSGADLTYVDKFEVGNADLVRKTANSVYGGAGTNLASKSGVAAAGQFKGDILIRDTAAGDTRSTWLFGDFNQDGFRSANDLGSMVTAAQVLANSSTAAHGGTIADRLSVFGGTAAVSPNFTTTGGNNTTFAAADDLTLPVALRGKNVTKGDLIVLGDYNGDGSFDGKDIRQFAVGASILNGGAELTSTDQVRTGELHKNAALDQADLAIGTVLAADQYLRQTASQSKGALSIANDGAGANAFNKHDVDLDGKLDLNDAFVLDKFAGKDYTNLDHVLAATINANGTIDPTAANQVPYNLVNAKLVDGSSQIAQADMTELTTSSKGLNSMFSHTWANTAKNGSLDIVVTPLAGSTFTVAAGTTLTINAGSFTAGGAVDPFTDSVSGNHLNVAIAPGATLGVTSGTSTIGSLSLTAAGTASINVNGAASLLRTTGSASVAVGQTLSKIGSGELEVAGLNAAGTVDIQAGTFSTTGSSSIQTLSSGTGVLNVKSGNLVLGPNNSSVGGNINIQDGATLQAQGFIQRTISAPGASQTGRLQATGNLVYAKLSGSGDFAGELDTQGNYVQIAAPATSQLRSLTMANGGRLATGTGLKMPNRTGAPAAGGTGWITVSGTDVYVDGNFQGGLVRGDKVTIQGDASTTVHFSGIVRGTVQVLGPSVDYSKAANWQGWSPTFIPSTGTTFGANTKFVLDGKAAYSKGSPDYAPAGINGGYTQNLMYSLTKNGQANGAGIGTFNAQSTFAYDSSSLLKNASDFLVGDVFEIVRTDGAAWGSFNDGKDNYAFGNGSLSGYQEITLSDFSGLPTLSPGLSWQVAATPAHIALTVVPEPGSIGLLALAGLAALGGRFRRRHN